MTNKPNTPNVPNALNRQSLAPRLIPLASPAQQVDDKSTQSLAHVRRISSRALLGKDTCLVIDHEGVSYVLRATRLGKLILTK